MDELGISELEGVLRVLLDFAWDLLGAGVFYFSIVGFGLLGLVVAFITCVGSCLGGVGVGGLGMNFICCGNFRGPRFYLFASGIYLLGSWFGRPSVLVKSLLSTHHHPLSKPNLRRPIISNLPVKIYPLYIRINVNCIPLSYKFPTTAPSVRSIVTPENQKRGVIHKI